MNVTIPPPEMNLDTVFGRGINAVTGQPVGAVCVSGIKKGSPTPIDSDMTKYCVVEDSNSYDNLLRTAASMSGSGLCWSTSADMSYLKRETGKDTSISLVWLRMIQSKAIYADLTAAAISPEALDYLKAQGPAAFADVYGTHCVIGVLYGGSFIGRLRIDTASASEKEKISAGISASLKGFGMSGSVSSTLETDIDRSSSNYSSTLDAKATGLGVIQYNKFDVAGLEATLTSFKLPHDSVRDVDGTAFSLVCQTWDEFPEIAEVLRAIGKPNALQFTAQEGTLDALTGELDSLDYVITTASDLVEQGHYAIPAYAPLLRTMSVIAGKGKAAIQNLTMDQISRLTGPGLAPYIISSKLLPLLGAISHQLVRVQVDWVFDSGFIANNRGSKVFDIAPNQGELQVTEIDHSDHDPPQNMKLFFTLAQDATGQATLSTRMHWRDPYGPPGDADYYGNVVSLSDWPSDTSTAVWSMYNDNQMSAQLVGLDPSLAPLETIVAVPRPDEDIRTEPINIVPA